MPGCRDRRRPATGHLGGGALHGGPFPGAGRDGERGRPVEICRGCDRPPVPGGVQRLQHHMHHLHPHVSSKLCGRHFERLYLKRQKS